MQNLVKIAADPDHPQVIRAIKLMIDLSASMPAVYEETAVAAVAQQQVQARFFRVAQRLT